MLVLRYMVQIKYLQAVPVRLNPKQRTWSGTVRFLPRGDSLFTGRKSSGWRSWGVAMVQTDVYLYDLLYFVGWYA